MIGRIIDLGEKYCPDCERDLPAGEFYKSRATKDGLQSQCRGCKSQRAKKYRKSGHGRETIRKYEATERRHEARRKRYENNRGAKCETMRKYMREYRTTLKGRLAQIFHHINYRCINPNYKQYKDYGGRGIENRFGSLDEFRNYIVGTLGITTFEQIKGLQIDRIDNNGHYGEDNIRFVTPKENSNNRCTKRTKRTEGGKNA